MKMNFFANFLIASAAVAFSSCGVQKPRATPAIDPKMQDQATYYVQKKQNAGEAIVFTYPARNIAQTRDYLEHKKDEHLPNAKRVFFVNGQDSTLNALTTYRRYGRLYREFDYLGKAKDLEGKPALLVLTAGMEFLGQNKSKKIISAQNGNGPN